MDSDDDYMREQIELMKQFERAKESKAEEGANDPYVIAQKVFITESILTFPQELLSYYENKKSGVSYVNLVSDDEEEGENHVVCCWLFSDPDRALALKLQAEEEAYAEAQREAERQRNEARDLDFARRLQEQEQSSLDVQRRLAEQDALLAQKYVKETEKPSKIATTTTQQQRQLPRHRWQSY